MEGKELLTPAEAAARLHIQKRTILKWAREGKITCRRVSRKVVLFSEEGIDSLGNRTPNEVKLAVLNHQRAGRKAASITNKKGGIKKSSRKSWRSLREEVASWQ
jgi:excisionase family DNA binding protein